MEDEGADYADVLKEAQALGFAEASLTIPDNTSYSLPNQCGVNFFALDSRHILAPVPMVLGSDIKTRLKSSFSAIMETQESNVIF